MEILKVSFDQDLCPICKSGMTCNDIVFHAKNWNTKKRGSK